MPSRHPACILAASCVQAPPSGRRWFGEAASAGKAGQKEETWLIIKKSSSMALIARPTTRGNGSGRRTGTRSRVRTTTRRQAAIPHAASSIYTKDGKVERVEGDPLDPCANGKLCIRCLTLDESVNNPDRLKYPLRRARRARREQVGAHHVGTRPTTRSRPRFAKSGRPMAATPSSACTARGATSTGSCRSSTRWRLKTPNVSTFAFTGFLVLHAARVRVHRPVRRLHGGGRLAGACRPLQQCGMGAAGSAGGVGQRAAWRRTPTATWGTGWCSACRWARRSSPSTRA